MPKLSRTLWFRVTASAHPCIKKIEMMHDDLVIKHLEAGHDMIDYPNLLKKV